MCLCIVTVSMSKWVSVSLESPRLQPATRYSWQKTSAHCSAMSNVQSAVLLTAHYTFHSVHVSLHPVNCRMVHIHIHIHISISTLISFPVIHNMYTLSLDCSGDIFWSPFLRWDNSSIFAEPLCAPTFERSFLYFIDDEDFSEDYVRLTLLASKRHNLTPFVWDLHQEDVFRLYLEGGSIVQNLTRPLRRRRPRGLQAWKKGDLILPTLFALSLFSSCLNALYLVLYEWLWMSRYGWSVNMMMPDCDPPWKLLT